MRPIDMIGGPRMSTASVGAARPIRGHREVATLLIQKRMKTFVVAFRKIEERQERAIAAASFGQAAIDERREIGARELAGFECLAHDGPEILACVHSLPEGIRSR